MPIERARHHTLPKKDLSAAVAIALHLAEASESEQVMMLTTPDGSQIPLPEALQEAMLDLTSLMAAESHVSVVMLASGRLITVAALDTLLNRQVGQRIKDAVPGHKTRSHTYYETRQLIEAAVDLPDGRLVSSKRSRG